MSLDQRRARVFGVLYLITFVTSIPALLLYEPALRHPVGFVAGAGNVNKIYLGALLELLLIIANIGTAVVIVPIMRRQFEELSMRDRREALERACGSSSSASTAPSRASGRRRRS